jgi:diadenosine tetraphosphate (Ap4A) HIT family hydrolase
MTMSTLIHRRVEDARRGENPFLIARCASGWMVIGDWQGLRGYSLLLPDPVVPTLNDLTGPARDQFLRDMATLGDAVLEVTGAARINYEILGNADPALHAHVFPRFADEPEELRTKPVWFYTRKPEEAFDPVRDGPLVDAIRDALRRRGVGG